MKNIRRLALKRINILYRKALEEYNQNPELSRRYIFLLWKIKQKIQIRLPLNLRNKFCKRCFTPWIIGKTLSVRIRRGRIVLRCRHCNYIKRLPFKIKIR